MITLLLGGARSGKSQVGEAIAAAAAGEGGRVRYVATAVPSDDDPDLATRIAVHVGRRPPSWVTEEVPLGGDLAGVLRRAGEVMLVDSLGTWLAGAPGFAVDTDGLLAALVGRGAATVIVSDEVGLGVHPVSAAGRTYRDALGQLNRAVASVATTALLVVAGLVLPLSPYRAPLGGGE